MTTRRTGLLLAAVVLAVFAGGWWAFRIGELKLAGLTLVGGTLLAMVLGGLVWWRGARVVGAIMVAMGLCAVGTVGWAAWHVTKVADEIPRFDTSVLNETGERPEAEVADQEVADGTSFEEAVPLTVMLLGADDPRPLVDKPTIAELMEKGDWNPGAYRSDSIMLVRIAADRQSATVVSLPRDSYVRIVDETGEKHAAQKINAAFSLYGPLGTLRTVETLSNVRIDHVAVVDFEGFRDFTDAVGGVDVYVAETFTDPQNDRTWTKGWNHLDGASALPYVRTRYGLDDGDFDRVARQQNFLRALMDKTMSAETAGDPLALNNLLQAVADNVTIDDEWDTPELRDLALELRNIKREQINFVTLPLDRYERLDDIGWVNKLDRKRIRELFDALKADDMTAYLAKHPDDGLAGPRQIQ